MIILQYFQQFLGLFLEWYGIQDDTNKVQSISIRSQFQDRIRITGNCISLTSTN